MAQSIPVAFLLLRPNYLKSFGPLIDYFVTERADEFRVMILVPLWEPWKPEFSVDPEDIRSRWQDRISVVELPDVPTLADLMRRGAFAAFLNLDALVAGMSGDDVRALRDASRHGGVKWIALPELFSQDQIVVDDPQAALDLWDVVCTVGPRSVRYIDRKLSASDPDVARAVRDRLVITGYPELDGLQNLRDARTLRNKYGLPTERPIVYVSTAPAFHPYIDGGWRLRGMKMRFREEMELSLRTVVGYAATLGHPLLLSYRRYLSALRQFADRNDACLVAKTRAKHHDPAFLGEYLDHVFGDRCFYPFTTLELLSVSSLYFGFYSGTVLEAMALGLYSITALFLPPSIVQPSAGWRRQLAYCASGAGGLWNSPGVSSVIAGDRYAARAELKTFEESRLQDYTVDDVHRDAVFGDFVSHVGRSSERVADTVAECCG